MDLPRERKIIHVDMDAFYTSVEQNDHPEFRGKALVVGGDSPRGVVAAASYEARKYGIRSAMSSLTAKKLCPELVMISPRFDRYREVSQKIRGIFLEYTDLVEPLSLDEAYLDVTINKKNNPSASSIARDIRRNILEQTGLTASAGISINKFVAKVASDCNKPDGQKTVQPQEVLDFLEQLDIRKFYGIGSVTADKMYRLGIFTGHDLKAKSVDFLTTHFGKSGENFFHVVRGIQHSEVKPFRPRKSLGAECTFEKNISSEIYIVQRLEKIAETLVKRVQNSKAAGKTLTLKIKYSDFSVQTRSRTVPEFISEKNGILRIARELLYQEKLRNSVRLVGLSLSNLKEMENRMATQEKQVQLQLHFPHTAIL